MRMPSSLEGLRVPLYACALSAVCMVASYARVAPPARLVAEGTGTGSCGLVPWLRILGPCRGILLLELAPDRSSAWRLVDTLRQQDRAAPTKPSLIEAAETSVRRDYFLIPSYVAFLGFLGMVAVRLAELRGPAGVIRYVSWAVFLQLVAGVLDGLENIGLFTMLEASGRQDIPLWTGWVSTVKWWLVTAGLVVPLFALVRVAARGGRRAVGPTPRAFAEPSYRK
jgi:hypothetical protein